MKPCKCIREDKRWYTFGGLKECHNVMNSLFYSCSREFILDLLTHI